MAAYHIVNKEIPEDKGVIVSAQNSAQAIRKVTDNLFTITPLNTDGLAARVQDGVPFLKETKTEEAPNANAS